MAKEDDAVPSEFMEIVLLKLSRIACIRDLCKGKAMKRSILFVVTDLDTGRVKPHFHILPLCKVTFQSKFCHFFI